MEANEGLKQPRRVCVKRNAFLFEHLARLFGGETDEANQSVDQTSVLSFELTGVVGMGA